MCSSEEAPIVQLVTSPQGCQISALGLEHSIIWRLQPKLCLATKSSLLEEIFSCFGYTVNFLELLKYVHHTVSGQPQQYVSPHMKKTGSSTAAQDECVQSIALLQLWVGAHWTWETSIHNRRCSGCISSFWGEHNPASTWCAVYFLATPKPEKLQWVEVCGLLIRVVNIAMIFAIFHAWWEFSSGFHTWIFQLNMHVMQAGDFKIMDLLSSHSLSLSSEKEHPMWLQPHFDHAYKDNSLGNGRKTKWKEIGLLSHAVQENLSLIWN